MAGPARAMKNSSLAFLGSVSIWAAAPKMNRVMRGTLIPWEMATTLWASSWSSTEKNIIRLVMTPIST